MIGRAGPVGSKPSASSQLQALGPLEVEEVTQGALAEPAPARAAPRPGSPWPGGAGAGRLTYGADPDRGQKVVHQRPVEHLLGCHLEDDERQRSTVSRCSARQGVVGLPS